MLVACRAYGLRPIDGPFGDFADKDGYLSGKNVLFLDMKESIIHPSQIELANSVYTPTDEEVKAERIILAMKEASKEGKGAVSLD